MNWEEFKEQNAAWYEPFIALPILVVVCLIGAVFWVPLLIWYGMFHVKHG